MNNTFVSLACTACTGTLNVDSSLKKISCPFCGTAYLVKNEGGAASLSFVEKSLSDVQVSVDKTASELAISRLRGELVELESQQKKLTGVKGRLADDYTVIRASEQHAIESKYEKIQRMSGIINKIGWFLIAMLPISLILILRYPETIGCLGISILAIPGALAMLWISRQIMKKRSMALSKIDISPKMNRAKNRLARIEEEIDAIQLQTDDLEIEIEQHLKLVRSN